MLLDLAVAGANSRGQITVENDSQGPLPVDIVVSRLEIDENGKVASQPAGEEFLIIPPQAMVKAGASQVFRIQWVGDANIKLSQSYTFSVNQVPVKLPEGESGVQMVFNFGALVNIAPSHGVATLSVVKSDIEKDKDGKSRAALTFKNTGNMHAELIDATIKMSGGAWSTTLTPSQLHLAFGTGLVQPGKTRKFLMPGEIPADVSKINASVDFKPKY